MFYRAEEFSARIIGLKAGESIPACEMTGYVIFVMLAGQTRVTDNERKEDTKAGDCLITEPATLSLQTDTGVNLVGIRVAQK